MTRPELLNKLDRMLATAEREKMFGSIEIELRAGQVCVIRKLETERIENGQGSTHADRQNYR